MPYLRHVYHIDGITDLTMLVKEAQARAHKGGRTIIHQHGAGRPCNGSQSGCQVIEPGEDN